MKKFIIVTILLLAVGAACFFGIKYSTEISKYIVLERSYTEAKTLLDSYGEMTIGYTVKDGIVVNSGDLIREEDLVEIAVPLSIDNNTYVTDLSTVLGSCYKIPIKTGTPLTTDMVMLTAIDASSRDCDIIFDRHPVGLAVGDYIDYKIQLPDGNEYVVIPKARIYSFGTNTIKVYLNLDEQYRAASAFIDYCLYKKQGASLYLTKYIEPGIQEAAQVTYAVRSEIQTLMFTDVNYMNKNAISTYTALRTSIDMSLGGALNKNSEEYVAAMENAYSDLTSKVAADYSTYYVEDESSKIELSTQSAWDAMMQATESTEESEVTD